MEVFLKKIFEGAGDGKGHRHFVRFGKGNYPRRFIVSFAKTKKLKVKASFELANDFVNFFRENSEVKFSGKILTKEKIEGQVGKKKAGSFVYEVSESSLEEFENAYYYLLDANEVDIVLKIKKKLPKPGKNADKIDDKFCVMVLDLKYWDKVKDAFFWDVPECKKALVEHDLIITDIVIPEGEEDPVKIRELAKRKGKIIRKVKIGDDVTSKEANFEA